MYSVHYPCYDKILDILSLTNTNSPQTSSLPLADFWHPERINRNEMKEFCKAINIKAEDLNPQKAEYSFEYPTPAYETEDFQRILDHSVSMSDLMIRLNDEKGTRITIEAKYTEYGKKEEEKDYSPFLWKWYNKDKPTPKKIEILKRWTKYIRESECGCGCKLSLKDEIPQYWHKFPYQFLHRTASACFNCSNPILVYQLFYDQENCKAMEKFRGHLQEWVNMLLPTKRKLQFFIIETEIIKQGSPALDKQMKIKDSSDLFIYMKNKEQYKFGAITVRDGYDTTKTLYNYVPKTI